MSKAVPWSTDVRTIGRPNVTLTAFPNASSLIGNQPLVVIAGDDRVEFASHRPHENGVRRTRSNDVDATRASGGNRRSQDVFVLRADQPVLARVRVEGRPTRGEAMSDRSEATRRPQARSSRLRARPSARPETSASGRCTLASTTRSGAE